MKQHTLIGHQILHDSSSDLLQLAAEIALTHHERFDGSGYPHGTKSTAIPLPLPRRGDQVSIGGLPLTYRHDRPSEVRTTAAPHRFDHLDWRATTATAPPSERLPSMRGSCRRVKTGPSGAARTAPRMGHIP